MRELIDPPTSAEHVAGMISGTATTRSKAIVRPVLVRIPINQLINIDAMCQLAGKSRSQMVVNLLEVGLDGVNRELQDDARQRLHDVVSQIALELVDDSSNESDDEVA